MTGVDLGCQEAREEGRPDLATIRMNCLSWRRAISWSDNPLFLFGLSRSVAVRWLVRRGRGAPSGPGFVDHFFPDAFGLEDDLDEFARGTFAAIGFGGVVGGPAHFRGGVVNGDGQSYPLHEGQVRQVIAEKGDFRFLCAGFPQDVFVSGNLVALLLVDKLDVQLFTPSAQSRAAARVR